MDVFLTEFIEYNPEGPRRRVRPGGVTAAMKSGPRSGRPRGRASRGPAARGGRIALAVLGLLLVASLGCSTVGERVHLSKGTKLYKAQKYEDAIQEFQKIFDFKKDSWHANYMIAISYLALYHPGSQHPKDLEYADKAVAAFERLMQLPAPDDATRDKVRSFYVNLLMQSDKLDKAIGFYEGLLQKEPNNLDFLATTAQLYAKKGDFAKAIEYYEKRADTDPTNKDAWYTIGVACWERSYKGGLTVSNAERSELVRKGLAAIDKALGIDPEYTSALAYANLLYREQAKVLLETGDAQAAGNAILKADEYQKKALAIINKNRGAPAPPKAGA